MPLLKIQTNQMPAEERVDAILQRWTSLLSRVLEKSESFIMVALEENANMAFGGTREPLAYAELKSLGLPADRTSALSAALCEHIAEDLGVEMNRVYIEFSAPERSHWGWNGKTFG